MIKGIDLINGAKQEFAKKQITITDNKGNSYQLLIQEKLNESTLMELIAELQDRANFCKINDINFDIVKNTCILLIKYFTDIKFNNYKSFEKQYNFDMQLLKSLIDLNLYEQIIDNFSPEAIDNIAELYDKYEPQMKMIMQNYVENEVINNDEENI